jgi:hypothetical protein
MAEDDKIARRTIIRKTEGNRPVSLYGLQKIPANILTGKLIGISFTSFRGAK